MNVYKTVSLYFCLRQPVSSWLNVQSICAPVLPACKCETNVLTCCDSFCLNNPWQWVSSYSDLRSWPWCLCQVRPEISTLSWAKRILEVMFYHVGCSSWQPALRCSINLYNIHVANAHLELKKNYSPRFRIEKINQALIDCGSDTLRVIFCRKRQQLVLLGLYMKIGFYVITY